METVVANKVKIDSFKLLVDRDRVNFSAGASEWKHRKDNEVTGETIDLPHLDRVYTESNIDGIKISLKEYNFFRKPKVEITVHSKMLKNSYFDGLNIDNIETAYDTIMMAGKNVYFIDKETFMERSKVCDIDICKDIYCNASELIKTFDSIVRDWSRKSEGKWVLQDDRVKIFKSELNRREVTGLECQKRENSKLKMPHFKVYSKFYDMLHYHKDFFLAHNMEPIKNLTRIETCLRHSTDISKVIGRSNRLNDVLSHNYESIFSRFSDMYGLNEALLTIGINGGIENSAMLNLEPEPKWIDDQENPFEETLPYRLYVDLFFSKFLLISQNRGNLRQFRTAKDVQDLMEDYFLNMDRSKAKLKKLQRAKQMLRIASEEVINKIKIYNESSYDSSNN